MCCLDISMDLLNLAVVQTLKAVLQLPTCTLDQLKWSQHSYLINHHICLSQSVQWFTNTTDYSYLVFILINFIVCCNTLIIHFMPAAQSKQVGSRATKDLEIWVMLRNNRATKHIKQDKEIFFSPKLQETITKSCYTMAADVRRQQGEHAVAGVVF